MPTNRYARLKQWGTRLAAAGAIALAAAAGGCGGSNSNFSLSPTFGPAIPVENGTAKTYITTDNNSIPHAIGVVITTHALDNTPTVVNYPNALAYTLPLPTTTSNVPFRSVTLFTTAGHEPSSIFGQTGPYEVPHIHIAFSLYTTEQRTAIGARLWGLPPSIFDDPVAFPTYFDSNFDLPVNTVYVPLFHGIPYIDFSSIPPGQELPSLGTVYFSPGIPEFTPPPNTGPFTTEVDYAFFAGQMSSFNLTSNLNQLVTINSSRIVTSALPINIKVPLDLPTFYQTSGYYPTTYSITYDAGTQSFKFELGDMVFQQARDPAGVPLPQTATH